MPQNVEPLENLVDQFARFPGVGRKSAVRMAYQVMSMPPEQAMELAKAIVDAFLENSFEGGRHQRRLDMINLPA